MEQTNTPNASTEDKTVAILAYITLIGFIIAIVMHGSNKTKLGSYHLKQALGLVITGVASWLMIMFIAFIPVVNLILILLSPILWLGILVLVILGIMNAANGVEKPLPVVGPMFEKWFANAFN